MRRRRGGVPLVFGLMVWFGTPGVAFGDGATRDLSGYAGPGVTFTVSIAIDPPSGVIVGIQDTPPAGWTVSAISDNGTWDPDLETVKWPLFIGGSVPDAVSYDVTPPPDAVGRYCFEGLISFNGPVQDIEGDECISIGIPVVSEWGMAALTLLILAAGTLLARPRANAT